MPLNFASDRRKGQGLALTIGRAEEGRGLGILADAGGGDVSVEPSLKVMTHRNLSVLTALFPEAQGALFAQISVIGQAELRHSPDARAGIGQDAEEGAIAETDDVGGVDRMEQFASLRDAEAPPFYLR